MRFAEFLYETTVTMGKDDKLSDIARKQKMAERNPRAAAANEINQAKADGAAAQADKEDPASQLKQTEAMLKQRLAKVQQQIAAKSK